MANYIFTKINDNREELQDIKDFDSSEIPCEILVFNSSPVQYNYKNINIDNSKYLGVHCGSKKACMQRAKGMGYDFCCALALNGIKIFNDVDADRHGDLAHLRKMNIPTSDKKILEKKIRQCKNEVDYENRQSKIIRDYLLSKGYNLIRYTNSVEDAGNFSYIILDPSIISEQINLKPNFALV